LWWERTRRRRRWLRQPQQQRLHSESRRSSSDDRRLRLKWMVTAWQWCLKVPRSCLRLQLRRKLRQRRGFVLLVGRRSSAEASAGPVVVDEVEGEGDAEENTTH
jgi:hypothetical protein